MRIEKQKNKIPQNIYEELQKKEYKELRPSQNKAINQGLFENKNQLICTPTASGKTLVAEMSFLNTILNKKQKATYIVPLRALATEKYYEFKKKYPQIKTSLSTGELDTEDKALGQNDLIIVTSEKVDSLIRHKTNWLKKLGTIIIDEIHLLNDPNRGPTLEIVIAIIKKELPNAQIIGLSATIGNPEELSKWLNAELIKDDWRPVKLKKGIYHEGQIHFKE